MRWFAYFILAYLALGFQIGLSGYAWPGRAVPNLVLLAVIFVAVNAPRDAALLGAFGLGLLQDLTTMETLGVYAFSYSLVALFTSSTQSVVYRSHPLTHFSLTFFGAIVTGMILLIHGWIRGPAHAPLTIFYSALFTALLAPVFVGLLQRIRKAFSFQAPRKRIRV